MSADGFSLLWDKILDSSIWNQSAATRVVWITLLAMKNREGFVKAAFSGVRRNSNVTEEECREALRIFIEPDLDSSSKNDEGRRIREVEGGWFIINHDKYQYSSEEKREYWRTVKAKQRAKHEANVEVRKSNPSKYPNRSKKRAVEPGGDLVKNGGDPEGVAEMVAREMESNRQELEAKAAAAGPGGEEPAVEGVVI